MLSRVDNDVAWESCTYWPWADHSVYCPEAPLPDDCRQLFHLTLAVMTSRPRPDLSGSVHGDVWGQWWRVCSVPGEPESDSTHIHQCDMWLSFLKDKRFGALTLCVQIWDKVSHGWFEVHRLIFGVKRQHVKLQLSAATNTHVLKAARNTKLCFKVCFV